MQQTSWFDLPSRSRAALAAGVDCSPLPFRRAALGALALVLALTVLGGCTRRFFRERADEEVIEVLQEKDVCPNWKIDQFTLYPNPLARFAALYRPDRPPMPPDDPAAACLAPSPQKPGKAGVAWGEGTGYLDLLAAWTAENRARLAARKAAEGENGDKSLQPISHQEVVPPAAGPKPGADKKPGGKEELPLPDVQKPREKEKLPMPERIKGKEPPPRPTPAEDKTAPDTGPHEPFLITLDQAVQLGVLNSREFQNRREDLYLTALPVTLQRYSFAAQFFFTEEAIREWAGHEVAVGSRNRWVMNTNTGFARLFSTGALLTFQFANQTILNLSGNAPNTVSVSQIDLDVVQPLLRGGGRAVTLEPLTQAERDLVYEIRDYARFRKQFYVSIAAGQQGATLPAGGAPGIGGGVPIAAFAGVIRPDVTPGTAGRVILSTGQQAQAQGYLPTLLLAAQLANEEKNVEALSYYLDFYQYQSRAGILEKLQADQFESRLLNSRSRALQIRKNLRDALDLFKVQLGVPPNVPLELDDTPLRPIKEHLQRYDETFRYSKDIFAQAEKAIDIDNPKLLRARLEELFRTHPLVRGTALAKNFESRWHEWRSLNDLLIKKKIEMLAGERRNRAAPRNILLDLQARRQKAGEKEPLTPREAARLEELNREIEQIDRQAVFGLLEEALREYAKAPWLDKDIPEILRDVKRSEYFRRVIVPFNSIISEARAERIQRLREDWPALPPVIVDGIDLIKTDAYLAQEKAAQTALSERLDLMNAQAQVVDAWRQIRVLANSLLGVFNVRYHVDSSTPPGQAQPFDFDAVRTRHQLIFNGELPLVRKAERNAYRASLIGFERARRAFMASQDNVVAAVREEVRRLRLLAEQYRIQQESVDVAYPQEDSASQKIFAPVEPGKLRLDSAQQAALTNQLLSAISNKLNAQNAIYDVWVDYLIARMQLYLNLERLPLDQRGVWIDEFTADSPTTAEGGSNHIDERRPAPEQLPPPDKLQGPALGPPQ